jgi:hypothetical protein
VALPTHLVEELEAQAAKFGLSVPAYIAFLARVETRKHDARFVEAARFVFSRYRETLKALAQ